jgi:DHA1 family inner membrane transport protein
MAFLRNRAVNWLNLHSGIRALAEGIGGVFVLVFLLRAGISIPASLLAMALVFAVRFAIRPAVLFAATRVGLRPLIVVGSIVNALQYLPLAEVTGVDGFLLTYCVIAAVGDTFFWTSYHGYMSLVGDDEHRGHQISAGTALAALAGIVGPLVGAFALVTFGPRAMFGAAALTQALATLPLLAMPDLQIPRAAPGSLRAASPGVGLFMSDGWFAVTFVFVWHITLYVSLAENVAAYGGAMALAALVGAVSGLSLGRHIDAGHGRRGTMIAYFAICVTLGLRMFAGSAPWIAVLGNTVGAFAACLLQPAQMVPVYILAKNSPCALRFHIASEGGWDVGCMAGCATSALFLAQGASLAAVTPLALAGVGGQLYLLRRYYKQLEAW